MPRPGPRAYLPAARSALPARAQRQRQRMRDGEAGLAQQQARPRRGGALARSCSARGARAEDRSSAWRGAGQVHGRAPARTHCALASGTRRSPRAARMATATHAWLSGALAGAASVAAPCNAGRCTARPRATASGRVWLASNARLPGLRRGCRYRHVTGVTCRRRFRQTHTCPFVVRADSSPSPPSSPASHPLDSSSSSPPVESDCGAVPGTLPESELAQVEDGQWQRRYSVVGMCFTAFVLCNIDRVNLAIAILPMSEEFGWADSTKGVINSSFFWGYLMTQVLGGLLADRYGAKKVLSFGVAWWSVATALTPIAAQV
eukprot:scaffold307_cov390-Prasinococcus_capsulatus_cf.AAC.4